LISDECRIQALRKVNPQEKPRNTAGITIVGFAQFEFHISRVDTKGRLTLLEQKVFPPPLRLVPQNLDANEVTGGFA
jgi:hypothetical protein